ncbi:MAG: DUF4344 domain-containing metallopeptidase [Maricaulaceae bacterium]
MAKLQALRFGLTQAVFIGSMNLAACQNADAGHDLELSEENLKTEFVGGNILDTLFHEMGHALIDQFDIPILGQEEDAADNLAAMLLLGSDKDHMIEAVASAAEGYFLMDDLGAARKEDFQFDDEHDLDVQRAYRQVCYLYGLSESFDDLAEAAELSDERAEYCPDDLDRITRDWTRVLKPHEGISKHPITVTYAPASKEHLPAKDFLMRTAYMEETAKYFESSYVLKRPLSITAESCGEANAFYDPEKSEITLCYEYIIFFKELDTFSNTGAAEHVTD